MHHKRVFAVFATIVVLALAVVGGAQERKPEGFIFAAPGGASPGGGATLHLGGGGEGFLRGTNVALGADLGYVAAMWHGSGFGLLDLDAGYHFKLKDPKVTPFFSGGYSLGFRSGHFNALNFGGGANVWLNRNLGLRLELRDVLHPSTSTMGRFQYVNARIGLTFR